MKKKIIAVFALAILFYSSLKVITSTEYTALPKGDAMYYSLMAINFDTPSALNQPIPLFYSQRLFPAFMGFVFSYPFMEWAESGVEYSDNEIHFRVIENFTSLRYAWEVSNFIAYSIQLLFIFLLLRHYRIKTQLIYLLLTFYSMWFLTVRLYLNWVQMADPWAFAFVSAASYFLAVSNGIGFTISVVLGLLCKEVVLFLLPSYLWKAALEGGLKKKEFLKAVPVLAIPVLVFIAARKFPYFPSVMVTPNAANHAASPLGSSGILGTVADYLFLIKFHYLNRIGEDPLLFLLDIVLIPFGTFSALLCFILWQYRRSYASLQRVSYWLPYAVLTLMTSLNVGRHLVYLFPVVLLVAAMVLSEHFEGKRLAYLSGLMLLVTFFQNQLYVVASPEVVADFSIRHQLELAIDLNASLANAYRYSTALAITVTFAGFWIISRFMTRPDKAD